MLSFILILLAAVIFPGCIALTKAKFSGRKGASILQPLFDIQRLLRKGSVYSTTSSLIIQIAPTFYLCGIVVAATFVPFGEYKGIFSFSGDFVVFAYLFALGKFMMIIGAMDLGSSFEGMGANREAFYSMLVEPSFFILMGSLALLTDKSSFYEFYNHIHFGSSLSYVIAVLGIYLLVHIALVENSRLPVDDPTTHLELTMIHEVMVLDHSGFDLGLIGIANALKFAIYGALISNFILPDNLPFWANILFFFAVQIGFAISVGWIESFRARNKIEKNPQFIMTLVVISVLVFFTTLILTHKLVLN
ncbi:MAG: NADH-quinone oxidoreductase subunit H [Flammeovirgaceae bacterium]